MGKRIEGEMDYSRMQRIHALLENEKVDRVPLWFMMEGFCPLTAGYSINSYYTDVEKSFWSQVWTYEMYELDEDPKWSHSAGGAIVFGGDIRFPTEEWMQAISVSRHPAKSEEDVYRLRMPDVKTAGLIPFAMEFAKLQSKYGMFIQPHVVDPFSFAGHVCGVDNLMRWVVKRPKTVHHLMRIAVNYLGKVMQYWVDTFGPERILPWITSSTSSNALISVRHFDQFVFPYFKELTEKFLEIGIRHIHHHLCGDHNFNLPLWSKVPRGNPGIISCAPEVDLSEAIKHFGDTCIIGGNVSPMLLQTGAPQEIYDAARQCIDKAKYAPRGFILMAGCDVPPYTPPYNIYTMLKAVRDYGYYG